MYRNRQNKGITLIALVITIIVLLILAGVSISLIVRENGITVQAKWSAYVHEYETVNEKNKVYILSEKVKKYKSKMKKIEELSKEELIELYPIIGDEINYNELSSTLKNSIKEIDGDLEGAILYNIDFDKIEITKKEALRDYIVNLKTGMIYSIQGEYYKNKVWHTPRHGKNIDNYLFEKPGTYSMTVNAGTIARWIELVRIGEYIPDGGKIEYTFATSNDKKIWTEEYLNVDDLENSQYVRITVKIIANERGESPKVKGLLMRFEINEGEVVEEEPDLEEEKNNDSSSIQIIKLKKPEDSSNIRAKVPIIVTSNKKETTYITNIESTSADISSLPGEINNYSPQLYFSNDGINWVPGTSASGKYEYVKFVNNGNGTNGGNRITVSGEKARIGKITIEKKVQSSEDDEETEWITKNTRYYYADATKIGEWINIETDETLPKNTRIIYEFSKSNDFESWTAYSSSISDNGNSRYIQVKVLFQVRTAEETEMPVLNDIVINYRIDGNNYKKKMSKLSGDLTLSKTDIRISIGQKMNILANFGENDVTKLASWTSSNNSFAKVNNGIITGIAVNNGNYESNVTITVKYGGKTKICNVTVVKLIEEIYTIEDLGLFANQVNLGDNFTNKKVTLKNDLNFKDASCYRATDSNEYNNYYVNTTSWTPIGTSSTSFSGTFDGNKKSISNLYIFNGLQSQGLFSVNNGRIENLEVIGNVTCSYSSGGIVGTNNGTISECKNRVIISATFSIGGIAGINFGTIEKCINYALVTGTDSVGGITGTLSGSVYSSANKGDITGDVNVGGIVGLSNSGKQVRNVYNTGNIYGKTYDGNHVTAVGGITGLNFSNSTLYVAYNTGNVTGVGYRAGGIVGTHENSSDLKYAFNTGIVYANGTRATANIGVENNCSGLIIGLNYRASNSSLGNSIPSYTDFNSYSNILNLGNDVWKNGSSYPLLSFEEE